MGLFKKKVVKEIEGGLWGHLFSVHQIDVDTLSKEIRCVEKAGVTDRGQKVIFVRVFKPAEAQHKKVVVSGWETFDQHPDLILFEGYRTPLDREVRLERRGTV